MYDIDSFRREHPVEQRKEVIQEDIPLRAAIRGAVVAENLTAQEHWDSFLTYLAGMRELLEGERKGHEQQILANHVINQEVIIAHKMEHTKLSAMVETLDWVSTLPKALLETGDLAREKYAELRKGGENN